MLLMPAITALRMLPLFPARYAKARRLSCPTMLRHAVDYYAPPRRAAAATAPFEMLPRFADARHFADLFFFFFFVLPR